MPKITEDDLMYPPTCDEDRRNLHQLFPGGGGHRKHREKYVLWDVPGWVSKHAWWHALSAALDEYWHLDVPSGAQARRLAELRAKNFVNPKTQLEGVLLMALEETFELQAREKRREEPAAPTTTVEALLSEYASQPTPAKQAQYRASLKDLAAAQATLPMPPEASEALRHIAEEDLLSCEEAREVLDISQDVLDMLIDRGELAVVNVPHITRVSVQEYQEARVRKEAALAEIAEIGEDIDCALRRRLEDLQHRQSLLAVEMAELFSAYGLDFAEGEEDA